MLINDSGPRDLLDMHDLLGGMGRGIQEQVDNNSRLWLPMGAHRSLSRDRVERMNTVVYTGEYDEDEKEADVVWESIDKRTDSHAKDRREVMLEKQIEKYSASNPINGRQACLEIRKRVLRKWGLGDITNRKNIKLTLTESSLNGIVNRDDSPILFVQHITGLFKAYFKGYQIIYATLAGDVTLATAYSHKLSWYGLEDVLTNYAVTYYVDPSLACQLLKQLEMDDEDVGSEDTGEDHSVEPSESIILLLGCSYSGFKMTNFRAI
ncbi:hypothetical protein SUGI_0540480 [Cryptomeria japonica]|nr:hypothetical protein SUGI_0540480 [Cryptomeria japonica]